MVSHAARHPTRDPPVLIGGCDVSAVGDQQPHHVVLLRIGSVVQRRIPAAKGESAPRKPSIGQHMVLACRAGAMQRPRIRWRHSLDCNSWLAIDERPPHPSVVLACTSAPCANRTSATGTDPFHAAACRGVNLRWLPSACSAQGGTGLARLSCRRIKAVAVAHLAVV